MATLQECISTLDDIQACLSIYAEDVPYRPLQEQTVFTKIGGLVDKFKQTILMKDPAGYRPDRLGAEQWRRVAVLLAPLARCFLVPPPNPTLAATSKTRHASASAVATLVSLSTCCADGVVILDEALRSGLVGAFVDTLRQNLVSPSQDRVIRAMLYKCIETLMGLTAQAQTSPERQQALVQAEVVDVCLELLTSPSVEPESKLLASKTVYNCLVTPGRVVSALRRSKVTALGVQLQQLAAQIPEPATAASQALGQGGSGGGSGGGGGGSAKAISLPVLLPAVLNWVWFLPHYILDYLMDSLLSLTARIVALVWPEGAPGLPLLDPATGALLAGPLQCAQQSLPNRSLRQAFSNLCAALAAREDEHGYAADERLLDFLRGGGFGDHAPPDWLPRGCRLGLPARLVRVVAEGRPGGVEVRVALELLDEILAACESGGHRGLVDDALGSGLLAAMTSLAVFEALKTEAGVQGLSAYVRIAVRLAQQAAASPALAAQLRQSGVPASIAYLAFWPAGKGSLKLEALQAVHKLVQLDDPMVEVVTELPNFPVALGNVLLGGDPETRKPAKKSAGASAGGGKKKGASGGATGGGGGAAGGGGAPVAENGAQAARNLREQMQDVALDILMQVLVTARANPKVWQLVVESGMLPRLLQHAPSFAMQPRLLADLLAAVNLTCADHADDPVGVGALQAAAAPHVLPLLTHEDPAVSLGTANLLLALLTDMERYRSTATDLEQGDNILRALVAAAPAIDTADEVAAAATAAIAARGAGSGAAASGGGVSEAAGPGPGSERAAALAAAAGTGHRPRPGPSGSAASQASPFAGMDVDIPAASPDPSAAPEPPVAPCAGSGEGGRASGGGGDAGDAAPGGAGEGAEAAEPEVPELVDVTAQGLGLICAAMRSRLDGMRAGPGLHVLVLDGDAATALALLLRCASVLADAGATLPGHNAARRHLARALAYARPVAAELLAALAARNPQAGGGLPAPPQVKALLGPAERAVAALDGLPVLDVSLLPQPKPEEPEDGKEAAAAGTSAPRRGRAPGSGKRAAQASLPAGDGGPAAAASAQQQQPPTKRQRTATPAALAAAEAAQARRSRSAKLPDADQLAGAATGGSPAPSRAGSVAASAETAGAVAASAAAAAAAAALAAAALHSGAGPGAAPVDGTGASASAQGVSGEGKKVSPSRAAAARRQRAAADAGIAGASLAPGAPAARGASNSSGGGGVVPLPAMPQQEQQLSLQPQPHEPAPVPAGRSSQPLSESPCASAGNAPPGPPAGADRSTAGTGPGGGDGAGAATAPPAPAPAAIPAGGSRVSVPELVARYRVTHEKNKKLEEELAAARAKAERAEAAEAQQRITAERLAKRTQEVEELLAQLEEKDNALAAAEAVKVTAAKAAQAALAQGATIAGLKSQLAAAREAAEAKDAAITALTAQLAAAREAAAAGEAAIAGLQGQLAVARAEAETERSTAQQLRVEVAAMREELEALKDLPLDDSDLAL
ncbi:hypothetical protein GPECTOR_78g86 [Gonium pectorale]|uniref:Uncharacterized protein n=1 Tax=Gonium pectorale TaxID=33097 RepID=A0A150G233_GONPE|nr:hypothetical protein GPECTOR_78g86 [Gonium pectorale]|eukprot:KXZ43898.1 hypothetical protein GPECTOR_78g86 [Gonium pectorale]